MTTSAKRDDEKKKHEATVAEWSFSISTCSTRLYSVFKLSHYVVTPAARYHFSI